MNDIDFNNIRPGKLSSSSEFHSSEFYSNGSHSKLTRNSSKQNLCPSDHSLNSHPPRKNVIGGHVGINSGRAIGESLKQLDRFKVLDIAPSKKLTSIFAPSVNRKLNTSHESSFTKQSIVPRAIAKRPHRKKDLFLVNSYHISIEYLEEKDESNVFHEVI